jgi:hypothetical protein
MASPGTPNPPNLPKQPCKLQRSISIREATTSDGFKILSNKHYTYLIEEGTLNDAIQNGYIDARGAMLARTAKARSIAREILANQQRTPDIQDGTKKHETIDGAKSAVTDAGDECQSEDAGSSEDKDN